MGLNKISIAAVIALLGAVSVLHAETATQPASPAASPVSDPALQASPIAGTTPAVQPAASPEATPSAVPSAPTPETTTPAQTKGDVLTVPKKKPVAAKKKKPSSTPIRIVEDGMPGQGASMSQVEKHFGPPREKLAPVGNPPITRWVYGDYTVYFEHEYVIHSVRNEAVQPPEPAQPAATQQAPQQPVSPATMAPAPVQPAMQPAPAVQPAPAAQPSPVMEPAAPVMEPAAPVTAPVVPESVAPASGQ